MRNRVRTQKEFAEELQRAIVAGELLPDDPGYAFRGAAASDLLARWREKGEDVNLVAEGWNAALRPFRVTYWVLGIPLFSIKRRPILIAPTGGR